MLSAVNQALYSMHVHYFSIPISLFCSSTHEKKVKTNLVMKKTRFYLKQN